MLVRTSNLSSCELQGLELADGRKVYEATDLVKDWEKSSLENTAIAGGAVWRYS